MQNWTRSFFINCSEVQSHGSENTVGLMILLKTCNIIIGTRSSRPPSKLCLGTILTSDNSAGTAMINVSPSINK